MNQQNPPPDTIEVNDGPFYSEEVKGTPPPPGLPQTTGTGALDYKVAKTVVSSKPLRRPNRTRPIDR